MDWFRKLAAKKYDSSTKRKPGRPRTKQDIRELVVRLAKENPGSGYTKIRDALWGLKQDIARSTVACVLEEAREHDQPGNDNGISDVVQRRKRLGGILTFYHRRAA